MPGSSPPAARTRRVIKVPKKYMEDGTEEVAPDPEEEEQQQEPEGRPEHKFVYRLLKKPEIGRDLVGQKVFVLWPANGIWYEATLKSVKPRSMTAELLYTQTDEFEEANLRELIKERSLAVMEPRRVDHQLRKFEFPVPEEAAKPELASDDDIPDAGEIDDGDSDSDMSALEDEDSDSGSSEGILEEEMDPQHVLHKDDEDEGMADPSCVTEEDDDEGDLAETGSRKRRSYGAGGRSAKRARGVHGYANGDDEDDSDNGPIRHRGRGTSGFYGRQSQTGAPGSLQHRTSTLSSDSMVGGKAEEALREKVTSNLKESLERAQGELKKDEAAETLPDPSEVATAAEQSLYTAYGGVSAEYKDRYRSLIFNLRDAKNPQLRQRVLQGEVDPHQLVRMSAAEMASKELSQWRKQQQEQALRNSVLDEEAAAKFSAAAAIAAKAREKKEKGHLYGDSKLLAAADDDAAVVDTILEETRELQAEKAELEAVGRRGSNVSEQPAVLPQYDSGDGQPASDDAPAAPQSPGKAGLHAGADTQPGPTHSAEDASGEANPSLGSPGMGARHDSGGAAAGSVTLESGGSGSGGATAIRRPGFSWTNKPGPTQQSKLEKTEGKPPGVHKAEAVAPHRPAHRHLSDPMPAKKEEKEEVEDMLPLISFIQGQGRSQVWKGPMAPGLGQKGFEAAADSLAGGAHLSGLMQDCEQVALKGRLALDKCAEFLEQLRSSRSRTVTVGLLYCAPHATANDTEHFAEWRKQYGQRQRVGVVELGSQDKETYLIPDSLLARRLLRTARLAAQLERAPVKHIPTHLPEDSMLMAVVHRKGWAPPPTAAPTAAPVPAAQSTEPAAEAHASVPTSHPPAADGNAGVGSPKAQAAPAAAQLDLSSLAALASALGVPVVGSPGLQGSAAPQLQAQAPLQAPQPQPQPQAPAAAVPDLSGLSALLATAAAGTPAQQQQAAQVVAAQPPAWQAVLGSAGRGQAQAPAAPATAPQLDLSALQSLMTSLGQQPPPPPPPPQAATAQQAYLQGGAGVRQAPGMGAQQLPAPITLQPPPPPPPPPHPAHPQQAGPYQGPQQGPHQQPPPLRPISLPAPGPPKGAGQGRGAGRGRDPRASQDGHHSGQHMGSPPGAMGSQGRGHQPQHEAGQGEPRRRRSGFSDGPLDGGQQGFADPGAASRDPRGAFAGRGRSGGRGRFDGGGRSGRGRFDGGRGSQGGRGGPSNFRGRGRH